MPKLVLCVFACLPALASTVTYSGTCTMSDGFSQSWSMDGVPAGNTFTCTDPGVLDANGQPAAATFYAIANTSVIDPEVGFGTMEDPEASIYPPGIYPGYEWTTLTETISIQEQETFIPTGGTGQGFIEGQYYEPDGNVAGGGSISSSFSPGAFCGAMGAPAPFTPIPFTFGQPLTLFIDATVDYAYDPPNGGACQLDVQTTAIVDANGNPLQGVQFTQTPEPAGLTALGMLLLVPMTLRRITRR